MKTCNNCYWKRACHLRSSGHADRCDEWKSERLALADALMIAFATAMFVLALGIVPLLILTPKGF